MKYKDRMNNTFLLIGNVKIARITYFYIKEIYKDRMNNIFLHKGNI